MWTFVQMNRTKCAAICSINVHCVTLFVFQRDDPRQNGVKLLTPVSDLVFNALSDGTIYFALYGSSLNHNLIGCNNSNSQSEIFALMVLKAAMERKKKGTIWKSNENWVRNWCQKWHTILFTATNQENKQCLQSHPKNIFQQCYYSLCSGAFLCLNTLHSQKRIAFEEPLLGGILHNLSS